MKSLMVFLALSVLGLSANAAEVKITSFVYETGSSHIAELCGQVTEATTFPSMVQVVVDPRGKHSANYNTFAGKDGNFCLTVVTYTGEANASLM